MHGNLVLPGRADTDVTAGGAFVWSGASMLRGCNICATSVQHACVPRASPINTSKNNDATSRRQSAERFVPAWVASARRGPRRGHREDASEMREKRGAVSEGRNTGERRAELNWLSGFDRNGVVSRVRLQVRQ